MPMALVIGLARKRRQYNWIRHNQFSCLIWWSLTRASISSVKEPPGFTLTHYQGVKNASRDTSRWRTRLLLSTSPESAREHRRRRCCRRHRFTERQQIFCSNTVSYFIPLTIETFLWPSRPVAQVSSRDWNSLPDLGERLTAATYSNAICFQGNLGKSNFN